MSTAGGCKASPSHDGDARTTAETHTETKTEENSEDPQPAATGALSHEQLYALVERERPTLSVFPKTEALMRLDMPVHGRWATTYVNELARQAVDAALADPSVRVEFPPGSLIVKDNYFGCSEEQAKVGVTTVLYNAGGDFCDVERDGRPGARFDGKQCLGGSWQWELFMTRSPKVDWATCEGNCDEAAPTPGVAEAEPGKCLPQPMTCADDELGCVYENEFFVAKHRARDFCVNCHSPAYDTDYVRTLDRLIRAEQPSFVGPTPPGSPTPSPADLCEDVRADSLSPDLPHDVGVDPMSLPKAQRQRLFDCLSWRTFVALSWPAKTDSRGEPDTSARIGAREGEGEGEGDRQEGQLRPVVWETYKEAYEFMQSGDVSWKPSSPEWQAKYGWNRAQQPPEGKGCDALGPGDKVLFMAGKSRSAVVADELGQAFAGNFGTLIDQNQRLVRYAVRVNRDEFEFITTSGFADTANLTPAGPFDRPPRSVVLPAGRSGEGGPVGAIEIKAAWRELCVEGDEDGCSYQDEATRYVTQSGWIYDHDDSGQAQCRRATLGLVGLHVAHKTWWAPQWVWSTFEHIDNVPGNDGNDSEAPIPAGAGQVWSFFDPRVEEPDSCSGVPFLRADPRCRNVAFNRIRAAHFDPAGEPFRSQVTRLDPVLATDLNDAFAAALGRDNPWSNYRLVTTQWPANGRKADALTEVATQVCAMIDPGTGEPGAGPSTDCFTIEPPHSRNTSMESFMATYQIAAGADVHQVSSTGCMNCHVDAGVDASYMWLDGVLQVVRVDGR